jgi:hypothetical protein
MSPLQQMKQRELNWEIPEPLPRDYRSEEFIASYLSESPTGQARLMENILERSNMNRAIKRVIKNKGAPGVDGMTVHKVKKYFRRHRDRIEAQLLTGTYVPMPVRRKEIPKPGGVRLLGIPTVLDRVIQPRQGAGSSTGDGAGADVNLGSHLFRQQLRLPAGTFSA